MSKNQIENRPFSEEQVYGIISISNGYKDQAQLRYKGFHFLEFFHFDDVDKNTAYYDMETKSYKGLYPMTMSQARLIAHIIKQNWNIITVLIIQCGAGISRSAGIAGAVYKHFIGDDSFIFDSPKYKPNMHCYSLLLKELKDGS